MGKMGPCEMTGAVIRANKKVRSRRRDASVWDCRVVRPSVLRVLERTSA